MQKKNKLKMLNKTLFKKKLIKKQLRGMWLIENKKSLSLTINESN